MTRRIIDRFLEDQKKIAPNIDAEPEILLFARSLKRQLDVARGELLLSFPAHAAHEIDQVIALRVDGPDDVAHRRDRLARDARDC